MCLAKVVAITYYFQEFLRIFIQEIYKIPSFEYMTSYGELQYAKNDINCCFLASNELQINLIDNRPKLVRKTGRTDEMTDPILTRFCMTISLESTRMAESKIPKGFF
jgi:hypothetical protein